MPYYDQGYNVLRGAAMPQFGTAVLGGLQAGQDLRKGALGMQETRRKAEQEGKQQETTFHARGAYNVQQAKDKQGAYSRYRQEAISSGYETPEEMPEQYSPDMDETFNELIRGGQEFGGLTQPPADYTLGAGSQRISGTTGKVIAHTPYKPKEPKQVPMNFAKQFRDRLEMDIENLDALPKEDVKKLRNAASKKMRTGVDFEAAYINTLKEFGLREKDTFFGSLFGEEYELTPQAAPAQEQIPTGQSINQQQVSPEAMQRLEQIKQRRKELEALRGGGGA